MQWDARIDSNSILTFLCVAFLCLIAKKITKNVNKLSIGNPVRERHHNLDDLSRGTVLLGVIGHREEGGVSQLLRGTGRARDRTLSVNWSSFSFPMAS